MLFFSLLFAHILDKREFVAKRKIEWRACFRPVSLSISIRNDAIVIEDRKRKKNTKSKEKPWSLECIAVRVWSYVLPMLFVQLLIGILKDRRMLQNGKEEKKCFFSIFRENLCPLSIARMWKSSRMTRVKRVCVCLCARTRSISAYFRFCFCTGKFDF